MLKLTEDNRKWWVVTAMSLALSLVFIDQSAVSVALPSLQRSLGLTNVMQQWVIDAYLLTLALFIILGGKIGDLIGHRKTFFLGIIVFITSSLACALANSAEWIIIGRAAQGIGGAFMIPTLGVMVISAFQEYERGKALGIYVGIASISLSLGPFIGGLLTEYYSWRLVFWINLPVACVSIVLALFAIPKSKLDNRRIVEIDWMGFIFQAIALCSIIFALMNGVNFGWTSPLIIGLLAAGAVFSGIFFYWEMHVKIPLVDIRIFDNPVFFRSVIQMLILQGSMIITIFWALYFQNILQFSPVDAGLAVLPATLPILIMAPIGGRLRDRFGPRLPVALGAFAMMLSALWIGHFAQYGEYLWLLPALILFGSGAPLAIASTFTTALSSVDTAVRGVASGIVNAARQTGGAIGLAVIGSVLASTNQFYIVRYLHDAGGALTQLPKNFTNDLYSHNLQIREALAQLSNSEVASLYHYASLAYKLGFSTAMYVIAFFSFLSFLSALKLPRHI